MKAHEKLRLVRTSKHLYEKEVYTAIGMNQKTYSAKERGIHRLWPEEKRLLERHLDLEEGYLEDDPLPLPVTHLSKADLINIVIDMQGKFIWINERMTLLEAKLNEQKGRKKK